LSNHMSIHMKSSVVAHWQSTFSIPMDTDGKLASSATDEIPKHADMMACVRTGSISALSDRWLYYSLYYYYRVQCHAAVAHLPA
jgi:hypothetical protein